MLGIHTRTLGASRPLLEDWSIVFPPEWSEGDDPLTLRRLIERIVRLDMANERLRQDQRSIFRTLTETDIADGVSRGRIVTPGTTQGRPSEPPASEEDFAVGNALQAFEDGLYLVVIDEVAQRHLDQQVHLSPESDITFIRLVMLAGG